MQCVSKPRVNPPRLYLRSMCHPCAFCRKACCISSSRCSLECYQATLVWEEFCLNVAHAVSSWKGTFYGAVSHGRGNVSKCKLSHDMNDIGHTEMLLIDIWMSGGCSLKQIAKDMQHHASRGTCGTRYMPRERKGEEPSVVHRTRTTMLWMPRPNNRELHDIHKAIEG